ncbi:MAG: tyrosine-type recombinase/integrase [Clostridia bacterium]
MTRESLIKLYVNQQREFEHSDGTINTYVIHINDFFNHCGKEPIEITKKDVKEFLTYRSELSPSTKNVIVSAISSFYKTLDYLELDGFEDKNPCMNIVLPKIRKKVAEPLSNNQVKAMLKFSKNNRDKAIIQLFGTSGLRVSELINLTLEQYLNRTKDNAIIIIGKGNKEAYIALSDDTVKMIDEYIKTRKSGCNNLFVSNQGTKMDRISLSRTLKVIAHKTGLFTEDEISNLHNHSLRHFTATNLSENGVPIEVIQEVLRHSNIATTRGYIDVRKERITDAINSVAI